MSNEQEYVDAMPFLGTWLADRRAKFVEGMDQLQAEPLRIDEVGLLMGLIVIDDAGVDAHYVPRERVLAKAMHESGMPAEALAVINMGADPGKMLALIVTPEGRALVEIPVSLRIINKSGGVN